MDLSVVRVTTLPVRSRTPSSRKERITIRSLSLPSTYALGMDYHASVNTP